MLNILENSESPQVKLINEWGQAFAKRDIDLIANLLHKDYRHISYPRSLGRPEETREEWLQHIARIINLWTEDEVNPIVLYSIRSSPAKSLLQPTVHSVIDIPGKVIVHVRLPNRTKLYAHNSNVTYLLAVHQQDEDLNWGGDDP